MKTEIMERLKNGCVVSCQALEDEPLFGAHHMAAMARAAEAGGAVGIRANTPVDVRAIKEACALPVIGLYKKEYPGSDVYITPTIQEVREIAAAGAEIVAIDATDRPRPDGATLAELVERIRTELPEIGILADVSTYEEGVRAMELGVEFVSSTMSGYTPYSPKLEGPDVELVARLSALKRTPVLAEGRIWTVEDCRACFRAGAFAVVIGTAITRPQEITKRFVAASRP
ncbi:N-acetylmannosamine-6-phosphate 2-epimerase [Paenibacillus sp.]|uniref:N-acetylmannosamine-6-phosphate 2-epimerase n=1 Tax=Paenibacillus sp. TaxID=58172 RepID=UPI002810E5CD|nr:N-acetylmannosamine-6-phosphate 2-epimerase [Paenibacillus sp.]